MEFQRMSNWTWWHGIHKLPWIFYLESRYFEGRGPRNHQMDGFLPFGHAHYNRNNWNSCWDQVLSHYVIQDSHFDTCFQGRYNFHVFSRGSRGLHIVISWGRQQSLRCCILYLGEYWTGYLIPPWLSSWICIFLCGWRLGETKYSDSFRYRFDLLCLWQLHPWYHLQWYSKICPWNSLSNQQKSHYC